MRRWLCPVVLFVAFILSVSSFAQKTTYPNTLLWRISGNNLKSPSYLYGTMHLQDKRLFNFGDSLYKALETVEGFAIEVDFKEYMDSLFLQGVRQAKDEMLEKQKVKIDKLKLDKSADSLLRKLGMDKNNLTKKDLKKIRDYRRSSILQNGEMPTIVDGYLFGLALRQHKWTGGIEDVADQMDIDDELGSELTPEKVLAPEKSMREGLEQMIKIYLKQDLQAIEALTNGYDAGTKDVLLTRRNTKMARRMDSLSAIRTMFFAVGAAHLPGDSGVIKLLQSRGFTVEPVFSVQKIAAEEYAKKLENIPWYKVEDESKLFTIEMPGNPSQFDEFGQAMKMKMYFDITTMTFYMTSQTIGKYSSATEFDNAVKQMAANMGAPKKLQVKNISGNNVEGREVGFEKDGYTFKARLLQKANNLFVLVAGSLNKKTFTSGDIQRFFGSFTAHNVVPKEKAWLRFTVPEKAFSILLPGQPKRSHSFDKQAEGSGWNFVSYDFVDNTSGLYYLVQVRDIKEGFFLEGDSVYFDAYKEETSQKMDSVLKAKHTVYKGFPAFQFDALYNKNVIYKTFHVSRGSRVYLFMVGGSAESPMLEADTLFQSLVFEDYTPVEWKRYPGEGFSTLAPAAFNKQKPDEADSTEKRQQFIAYNAADAVSYQVNKESISPLYWIKNDSTFFAEREAAYRADGDSILSRNIVYNGKQKALELVIQKQGLNSLQQVRLVMNGDTLYTLTAFIPRQYINQEKHQQFFTDFKVNKEIAPGIYTNKSEKLMQALKSGDSTEFADASDVFNSISFTKDDLPFLHSTLLENFRDTTEYYTVHSTSKRYISQLADTSTIEFVARNYATLSKDKEELKINLLELLAENKTIHSYSLLKKLLLSSPPAKGEVYTLANALLDSFELTAQIYPELLPLASDTVFADALAKITWKLLDSGVVRREVVDSYKTAFIKQAESKYKYAQRRDEDGSWWYYDWIKLLQTFNDDASNALLQKFSADSNLDMQYDASVALLRNNQAVQPAIVQKIAADKYYRLELFSVLKELGKTKLFPAKYHNQKSIAESELFQIASDDGEPSEIEFAGERTASFLGAKKKFYLFKVHYSYDEGTETYLGITGPYDLSSKEILTSTRGSGLVSDIYEPKKTDQQFKKYLQELETYLADEE